MKVEDMTPEDTETQQEALAKAAAIAAPKYVESFIFGMDGRKSIHRIAHPKGEGNGWWDLQTAEADDWALDRPTNHATYDDIDAATKDAWKLVAENPRQRVVIINQYGSQTFDSHD